MPADTPSHALNSTATTTHPISAPLETNQWYRPTLSPEHGVYVVLCITALTGIAAAHTWNGLTGLAVICAFLGFQAEHPIALQIKQRRTLKLRFLVWGGVYGGVALAIAVYLAIQTPIVLGIYAGAIAALLVDAIAVFRRQQRSMVNEGITFAAVCLSAPFVYGVTTGTISVSVMSLWLLNTLFFASSIFTLKFRKIKSHLMLPGVLYHVISMFLVLGLSGFGLMPLFAIPAFAIAGVKYLGILWQREWYCTTPIRFVALVETTAAIAFGAIVSLGALGLFPLVG